MKVKLLVSLVAALGLSPAALATQTPDASTAAQPGPRNVILMISDGAGFNGWLAADYYAGMAGQRAYQQPQAEGVEYYKGASSHYALRLIDAAGEILPNDAYDQAVGAEDQGYVPDHRWTGLEGAFEHDFGAVSISYTSYTDSAAAGTALHTGRKTSSGRVNLSWDGETGFETIAHIADRQGRATGVVTTVQASHATPASAWAQQASRHEYPEIFRQMADGRLDVIMGTGHPLYDRAGRPVENPDEDAFGYVGGRETWTALTSEAGLNGYAFIDTREAFEALAEDADPQMHQLVGIARSSGSTQATREGYPEDATTPSGMAFNPEMPDLATMSRAALNVLDQNPNGFFVMIEGGAVDWMGHANNMPRYIEEQLDFNAAVAAVMAWVETHSSWDETLLIITSDHETGGIWGEGAYAPGSDETRYDPARDAFMAFYAVQDRGAGVLPGYQFASGNHTNDLVPLWAIGPGASKFGEFERHDVMAERLWGQPYGWSGRYVDNTAVFHVMDAALSGAASD